jgi:EAL domain-containing protein (putative c-di-GMP-specific phosphodiesterase class I)/CHASE2 domain-containing sensor protein
MRRLFSVAIVRAILIVAVIAGLGSWLVVRASALDIVDASIQDWVLTNRSPESYLGSSAGTARDPRNFITIVAIDERTLSELGAYNGGYPRAYQAQVIEKLLAAPPRVIALDMGFFEPTSDDTVLAQALDHARSLPVPTTVILSAAGLPAPNESVKSAPDGELDFEDSLLPVPELADRASIGIANVVPGDHGTIRTMPLLAHIDGIERPSLGLAAVAAYLRRPTFADGRTADVLELAGRNIPLDEHGFLRIDFFGPPSRAYSVNSTFRVVSFVDVLRGRVDPATWRGGMVFIGALGAAGLADDYWTPVSDDGRKMAGVEIHANTAATLFSTNFLRSLPETTQALLTLGLALVVALAGGRLSILAGLVVGPLVLAGFAGIAVWILYAFGVLVPLAGPLLVGLASLLAVIAPRLVAEQRQARALRVALGADPRHDALVSDLELAIAREELRLEYQPKIDCRSGNVIGVEALVRWQHPERGLIAPDRFVPLAEQSGLIRPLTRWVLNSAVRQVRIWLDAGLTLKIAVNLSTHDLQDMQLPAQISELMDRHRVPAELLGLEITETALLADPDRAMLVLQELARRGLHASLDDFGTGYSSLTYLRRLPLQELKIDASFVRSLATAEADRVIVCSTIDLGHRLGLSVVAEGVEDRLTLELLAELGCDQAQGFYISRPLPPGELHDWVRSVSGAVEPLRRANAA